MADRKMMLRLAFRVEGEWWNAYIAEPGTMEGAYLVGSIRFGTVHGKRKRRDAFMALMKAAFEDAMKSAGLPAAEFMEERPAPQHERAGRA